MSSPFDQKKKVILEDLQRNSAEVPDASPKGTVDFRCLPLIETINAHSDMVTTSSCSGRVSVFLEGIKKPNRIGAKGNDGRWLFVTHDPDTLIGWHKCIDLDIEDEDKNLSAAMNEQTRYILYKFEPLILHVKCRDSTSANLLYSTAMATGFRESGVGSNNIVAIRTSIKLDIPIGYLQEERLISMVRMSYLEIITRLSLDRFKENFRKMENLQMAIASMKTIQVEVPEKKEERRLRKIKEGMERRDSVRAEKEKKKAEKLRVQAKASEAPTNLQP